MVRKLTLAAFAFALVACDRSKPELEKTLVQVQRISAEKDSLLKDVMATTQFIAEVNTEIAKVRIRNASRPTTSKSGDMESNLTPAQQRAQLLSKVKEITVRLNDAESRLGASRKRVTELTGNNSDLAKQIAAYDSTIAGFKSIIDNQKAEIVSLTAQISALNGEVTKLKTDNVQLVNEKTSLTGERDKLTTERNTVYYVVGTKEDLLKKHIIEQTGGTLGLGKVQVAARDLSPAEFTAVDKTKTSEILLPKGDKTYRIITRQDLAALETMPEKNKVMGAVKIKNPDQFWSASKFLIILEQ
jgi:predicted  nucleic acid-binding Zn-ribbon protein